METPAVDTCPATGSETSLFGLPKWLAPAPNGFSWLGLGFGWPSRSKPGGSACKPTIWLGKPFWSLNEVFENEKTRNSPAVHVKTVIATVQCVRAALASASITPLKSDPKVEVWVRREQINLEEFGDARPADAEFVSDAMLDTRERTRERGEPGLVWFGRPSPDLPRDIWEGKMYISVSFRGVSYLLWGYSGGKVSAGRRRRRQRSNIFMEATTEIGHDVGDNITSSCHFTVHSQLPRSLSCGRKPSQAHAQAQAKPSDAPGREMNAETIIGSRSRQRQGHAGVVQVKGRRADSESARANLNLQLNLHDGSIASSTTQTTLPREHCCAMSTEWKGSLARGHRCVPQTDTVTPHDRRDLAPCATSTDAAVKTPTASAKHCATDVERVSLVESDQVDELDFLGDMTLQTEYQSRPAGLKENHSEELASRSPSAQIQVQVRPASAPRRKKTAKRLQRLEKQARAMKIQIDAMQNERDVMQTEIDGLKRKLEDVECRAESKEVAYKKLKKWMRKGNKMVGLVNL
ncbi:hypothetical protein C8F01DRAFT_1353809 [Mycena amicta]|nr:hypothetical protein C8F01DRAFT_1353809 [Mycena amicta]